MGDDTNTSRRRLLGTAGSAIIGGSKAGLASGAAEPELLEVNIGYATPAGRQATVGATERIERRFAFEALTATVPQRAVSALQRRADIRYGERNGTMRAIHHRDDHDGGPGGGDDDTAQTVPWGIDRVDADIAHEKEEATTRPVASLGGETE